MKTLKIVLTVVLLFLASATLASRTSPIGAGEFFPDMVLTTPLGPQAASYLGVSGQAGFPLSQVQADLVLVEFLSVYCPHCQMQVEYFNRLREMIESDPTTRGRIKILGVAVASRPAEVEGFMSRFQVGYPLVPDPEFQLYHAVGAGVTPFSVYVRRIAPGRAGVVAATHTGLHSHPQELFTELRAYADTVPDMLLQKREKDRGGPGLAAAPVIPDDELETRLMSTFVRLSGGAISAFLPLDLPSGRRVYMADSLAGKTRERLFAEVAARHSICDICHDVHFFYVFDSRGKIIGFEPIQLSKWGNKPWNEDDVAKMRGSLVGSNLARPPAFNADVDAVTSATITSAVIFDAVGQGENLLRELLEKGYLRD